MKIENMTVHDTMQLMGSEASEAEAKVMLGMLALSDWQDTDDIGDQQWNAMIVQAVRTASAATLGKKGGSSKSQAKAAASRENGKLGGRPKVIASIYSQGVLYELIKSRYEPRCYYVTVNGQVSDARRCLTTEEAGEWWDDASRQYHPRPS